MNAAFSFGSYYPRGEPLCTACDAAREARAWAAPSSIVALMRPAACAALGAVVAVFVAVALRGLAHPTRLGGAVARAAACAIARGGRAAEPVRRTRSGAALVRVGASSAISAGGVGACLFVGRTPRAHAAGHEPHHHDDPDARPHRRPLEQAAVVPSPASGVPARELGMIMGIALRFLPQFATELANVYHAQISRGAALDGSPVKGLRMLSSVTIPLFASVFRHAETLSAAMDARCYHGEEGRTRLHPLRALEIRRIRHCRVRRARVRRCRRERAASRKERSCLKTKCPPKGSKRFCNI